MSRPLIGVLPSYDAEKGRYSLHQGNLHGILAAGGLPAMLPFEENLSLYEAYLARCDGFLFTGGGDIDPRLYGEEPSPFLGSVNPVRDAAELPLARLLAERNKPVLAICRGCQVLCAALGGTLVQDIPSEVSGALNHRQTEAEDAATHLVRVAPGSLLYGALGREELRVNSLHHQAVKEPGPRLTVSAWAPDGVCEAVELPGHPFYLGVQWHPERMYQHDPCSLALFRALVRAAEA